MIPIPIAVNHMMYYFDLIIYYDIVTDMVLSNIL